jgi:hypothetical protein
MAWAIANISIDAEFYRPVLAALNFIEHLATALLFKLGKINPLLVSQQAEVQLLPLGADFDDVKALTWSLATLCHGGFNTSDYWLQYVVAFDAFGSAMFLDNAPLWVEAW